MSRTLFVWALALLFAGCACSSGSTDYADHRVDNVLIGSPIKHANLTVFPLYLEDCDTEAHYLSLEQAMASESATVSEVASGDTGGRVNTVEVTNDSHMPLYLLSGQVILGGKQDRAIARDTIVPPGYKVSVEVCCVEQGRWRPRGAGKMQFEMVAESTVQSNIKMVLLDSGGSGQRHVWDNVSHAAFLNNAKTATGTYNEVIEKTGHRLDEILKAFSDSFEENGKICGFVACVNGAVETCDLFASPGLLAAFREKLLRSYALDSINAWSRETPGEADVESVKTFLENLIRSRGSKDVLARNKHARLEKIEAPDFIGFSSTAAAEADFIHLNGFRKR